MTRELRVQFPGAIYHVMGGEDHRCLNLLSLLHLKAIPRGSVICTLWLLSSTFLFAQTPSADELFVVMGGNYPAVRALAFQTDGSVWLAGWFTAVGDQQRLNIARLNADGTLDNHFAADANEIVDALVVQPDGKILAAG